MEWRNSATLSMQASLLVVSASLKIWLDLSSTSRPWLARMLLVSLPIHNLRAVKTLVLTFGPQAM
jgi:hypothetical protein